MQFHSILSEAVLLRRAVPFLAEVVSNNNRKMLLRCPYADMLPQCDVLGTKVWFSQSFSDQLLSVLELLEVDGGELVAINPEYRVLLVEEALNNQRIIELQGYNSIQTGSALGRSRNFDMILGKPHELCFVAIDVVINAQKGVGIFNDDALAIFRLGKLLQARMAGHRAIWILLSQNTSIQSVANRFITPIANELVIKGIKNNVEILPYATHIDITGIQVTNKINISS